MKRTALINFPATLFSTVVVFGMMLVLATVSVSAFTISPQQLDLETGESITIQVLADSTTANGVSVNLAMTNLSVTAVTVNEDLLSINTCDNGEAFTATTVCVDIAKKQAFVSGEVLAEVSVTKTGTEPATITAAEGSKYSDQTAVTGQLTQVPAVSGSSNDLIMIVVGGAVALAAVFGVTYMMSKSRGKGKASTSTSDISN